MLVGYGDQGMPLAGAGAPLVAEFAVTEFAAAIGLSTDAGKSYVGEALELRHRLPRVWRRVVRGDLKAWQARRIAERTLLLSREAASFVDAHVAPTAHKIGPYQLHALVEQAIADFMPDLAEERRLAKADGRYFTIEAQQDSYDGTAACTASSTSRTPTTSRPPSPLAASSRTSAPMSPWTYAARWRSASWRAAADPRPEPTRRSSLSRPTAPTAGRPLRPPHRRRPAAAPPGPPASSEATPRSPPGRSATGAEPPAPITVKPVIDLDTHDPVDSRRWCRTGTPNSSRSATRPASSPGATGQRAVATRTTRPPQKGGPTCPCNFAPLVSAAPPDQDPRRLDLPDHRARHLPVDLQARVPVPPRHQRHPRRQPRPAPATRLATPPHTPPTGGATPMPGSPPCPGFRGFEAPRWRSSHLNHQWVARCGGASGRLRRWSRSWTGRR